MNQGFLQPYRCGVIRGVRGTPEAWLPRLVHNPWATKPHGVQNRRIGGKRANALHLIFKLSVCSCARLPDRRYGYHGRVESGMGGENGMQARTGVTVCLRGPIVAQDRRPIRARKRTRLLSHVDWIIRTTRPL